MPRRTPMLTALTVAALAAAAHGGDQEWKKHTINGKSPFEAAGAFDVDGDGKLDVVSGERWYRGPDFKESFKVRDVSQTGTYRNCFSTLPMDVNGDGKMDFITCSYFDRNVGWVENPGEAGKPWTYHEMGLPGSSEAAVLVDLTGDGKPEVLPNVVNEVVFYELKKAGPKPEWKTYDFGKDAAGHGVGSGDVNGDGRIDLLTPKGWFESPENPTSDSWTWHPDWNLGAAGIQILARDVDGDGLNDLVYGMGHNYGLFWQKHTKDANGKHFWAKLEIDPKIASVHTLLWADIDGDGKKDELVTGKRVYAHEIEPGATDGSVIAWYKFDRDAKHWDRHIIFEGEPAKDVPSEGGKRDAMKDFPPGTAGTGLEMNAIDLDGDGDIDLLCPGKSGLYWMENPGKSK